MALVFLAVIHCAANLLLARAWWLLLRCLDLQTTWRWTLKTYGISQLAKYVPGNIFQFAGRQALGQAAGLAGKPLAKSTAFELILVAIAGVAFSALTIPIFFPEGTAISGLIAFIALLSVAGYGVRNWLGPQATCAMYWQVLFFVISSAVFIVILTLINPDFIQIEIMPILCGAYVVSWLIGFLTPGAPAGIGVRELVLTVLLDGLVPEASLLLAVVMGRLVTMIGDLWFFAAASSLNIKNA